MTPPASAAVLAEQQQDRLRGDGPSLPKAAVLLAPTVVLLMMSARARWWGGST